MKHIVDFIFHKHHFYKVPGTVINFIEIQSLFELCYVQCKVRRFAQHRLRASGSISECTPVLIFVVI